MLDRSPEAAVVVGPDAKILYLNRAACFLFDRSPKELLGAEFGAPVAAADGIDIDVVTRAGVSRVVELRTMPVPWGLSQAVVVHLRDVTPLRRAQEQVIRSEERFRVVFESAPVGMAICNLSGLIIDANDAMCLLTGRDRRQLEGSEVASLTHPDDRDAESQRFDALRGGDLDHFELEKRIVGAEGIDVPVQSNLALVRDADGNPDFLVAQFQDVSERLRLEGRLRYMAERDPLTGLLNRGAFDRELTRILAEGHRFHSYGALMMIDLDGLKPVNDKYGHRAGDELLIAVAEAISGRIRETDSLSRIGGDEYALLLPRSDRAGAAALAAALLEQIRTCVIPQSEERVTAKASVGVAILDGELESAEGAFQRADSAMYDAKRQGGDRYVVSDLETAEDTTRQAWPEEVEQALAEGGFALHAQSILSLSQGQVVRHELLIRYAGARETTLGPAALIDVAERFDRIREIDRWTLARALELLDEMGSDASQLDINLSGRSLSDPGFIGWIEQQVSDRVLEPGAIGIDIPEAAAISSPELLRAASRQLSELGFRITLDGFGSSLAAIQYAREFPFDAVKLSGELMSGVARDEMDSVITEAVIDIAGSLGKQVIATHVGDPETLAWCRDQGLDFVQGFELSRPAPVELVLGLSAKPTH